MTSSWPESLARFGRFDGLRCLGSGAFGVVYEAFDRQRGERVAIKALHRSHGEDLFRFKQEFRALADLRHRHLVRLHELLSDGTDWFFTMELVEGTPFLEWVWDGPRPGVDPDGSTANQATATLALPVPEAPLRLAAPHPVEGPDQPVPKVNLPRVRASLAQLVQGIAALHRSGKLHCDIKPSNILVTSRGEVRLLDFGLVTELDREGLADATRSKLVGTPNYMAPEQAGGRPLSPASDWYALGVVLYQALTGRLPFAGTFVQVLVDKQQKDPTPPSDLNAEVPRDLETLCLALLQRNPAARPGAEQLFQLLQVDPSSASTASFQPRARAILSPDHAPLGREPAMEALLDGFDRAREGWPTAFRILGPHGTGKGVLLKAFIDEVTARQPGVLVFQGRCYERESVPYKALDAILDQLSHELKRRPAQDVQALLPTDIQALARLFPVLRQVPAVLEVRSRTLEIRDSQELRRRAFGALRDLLKRLAERAPMVLAIEDVHWADHDSAALLAEVCRAPEPPHLVLVVTQPTGEGDGPIPEALRGLALNGGTPLRDVELLDLPPAQAERLATALLAEEGVADPGGRLAATLARESGGNPFFMAAFAAECASLAQDTTLNLEGFLERRLSHLAPGSANLLALLAVAGRPLETELAAEAAGVSADMAAAIHALLEAHLVTQGRPRGRDTLEIAHRRVQQLVLAGLDPRAARDAHLALAGAMEGRPDADAEALAEHYLEAGRPDEAQHHGQIAADQALRAMAFDRAARIFRMLLRLGHSDPARVRAWGLQLAQALVDSGRGQEAAEAFLTAADRALEGESLELRRRAAEQFLMSGHFPEGLRVLEAVLQAVHLKLPRSPRHALPAVLMERAWMKVRGHAFKPRDAGRIPRLQLARIDTCWSAAAGLSMWDPIRGAYFQGRHLRMALAAGESGRVARALCFEAGYSATDGLKSRARTEALIRQSQALAERVQSPYVLGLSHLTTGMARFLEGRWKPAHHELRQAETILRERCRGVAWELDMVQIYDLAALWFLGELRELASRTPALLAEARERGDQWALTNIRARVGHLPFLLQGDGEAALRQARGALENWPQGAFHVQAYWRLFAEAETLLTLDRAGDAWRRMEAERPALERSLVLRIQRSRLEFHHLRGRCALAAAQQGSRALLAEAEACRRRLVAEGAPWAQGLALALAAGLGALGQPGPEAPADLLRQAEAALDEQDMALYATACRLLRGHLLGGDHGAALMEQAERWLTAQGVYQPLALARMMVPGIA